jgi:hypothetical protein
MIDTWFSDCRTWRYTLSRRWTPDVAPRFVNFVLLNPSTADETQDDPTIRRCRGFAEREGFKAMVVTNLFAFRATKPADLRKALDPIGPSNDKTLMEVARVASLVVCGWGNHGRWKSRGDIVKSVLLLSGVRPYCLGMTHAFRTQRESPQPRHPLYLPASTELLELKA